MDHRDRLIDYDINSAKRLGVVDQRSDWYEIANNAWSNKEQKEIASQMIEIEKKRQEEIDSTINIQFDTKKGIATMKTDE